LWTRGPPLVTPWVQPSSCTEIRDYTNHRWSSCTGPDIVNFATWTTPLIILWVEGPKYQECQPPNHGGRSHMSFSPAVCPADFTTATSYVFIAYQDCTTRPGYRWRQYAAKGWLPEGLSCETLTWLYSGLDLDHNMTLTLRQSDAQNFSEWRLRACTSSLALGADHIATIVDGPTSGQTTLVKSDYSLHYPWYMSCR